MGNSDKNNIRSKKRYFYIFLSIILCMCLSVGVMFICSPDHQNAQALEIDDFQTAYDFKGITLGITLEEFRAQSHPDKMKDARVLCVRDKEVLSDLGKQFLFTLDNCLDNGLFRASINLVYNGNTTAELVIMLLFSAFKERYFFGE